LTETNEMPGNIRELALLRMVAKSAKNWWEADKIRDEIISLGYRMIDEKDGWRIEKIV
jgi:cysteinyl-tRNA synthetase